MKKLLFSAVLATGVLLAGCSEDTTKEKSTNATNEGNKDVKVIKVAQNILPNVPYSYLNEDGEMEGYTVEYLKLVDEKLEEYEFKYEQIDSDAMLIGVETGKYDFAANYYFRNPEREAKYTFGEEIYGYSITGLATKSDRTDINSLEDMQGKTLTPMNPSGGTRIIIDDFNKKHSDNPILIEDIDKITDADSLKLVDEGKYDAYFINTHNFNNVNKELNLDLKISALVSKEPIWVLFNKENTELAAKFDEITKELREDGTLAKLAEEWYGVDFFGTIDEVKDQYKFE